MALAQSEERRAKIESRAMALLGQRRVAIRRGGDSDSRLHLRPAAASARDEHAARPTVELDELISVFALLLLFVRRGEARLRRRKLIRFERRGRLAFSAFRQPVGARGCRDDDADDVVAVTATLRAALRRAVGNAERGG